MPQIKPGRYSEAPKGFLTYPIKGEKDTTGLQAVLLTEKREKRYIVEYKGTKLKENRVSKALWCALSSVGVQVRTSDGRTYTGRKSLIILKDGTQIQLPVEIRKIMNGKELLEIQIRVTGNTEGELLGNINAVKKSLSVWQIKPRECVWSQGAWQDISNGDSVVKEDEFQKELKRLKAIVESQATDIAELKEAPIKKAMKDDRDIMKGVLS